MSKNSGGSIQPNLREADWEELGTLCELRAGKPIAKMDVSQDTGEYPVVNGGKEPKGYAKEWNTDDPIGVTKGGANVGRVTWCEGKFFRGSLNLGITIRDRDRIRDRFLYYVLCTKETEMRRLSNLGVASIPSLSRQDLEKLEIPIPSLQTQKTIVSLLDSYSTNLEALIKGLEAEGIARQQQYEYYRNQLLSFRPVVR